MNSPGAWGWPYRLRMLVLFLTLTAPACAGEERVEERFKESALLDRVVKWVQANPYASASGAAAYANVLVAKEGLQFKVAFLRPSGENALEAPLYGDARLREKRGRARLTAQDSQLSESACGRSYYIPILNNPMDAALTLLESGPAYLKTREAFRFERLALLEKGRALPVRRWPLPDESEVPLGISRDAKTIYLLYRLASAETGWVPLQAGGWDHLVLAIGPEGLRFADEAEVAAQSWDTLQELPWKSPRPEGEFGAFGALKAWGKDYYFGFEPLCR